MQTLPFPRWIVAANAALLERAAIVFIADSQSGHWADSGADESDLRRLYDDGDSPADAAEHWADKYGLDLEEWDRPGFKEAAAAYLAKWEAAESPNHGGPFMTGEALAAGNGGEVCFCIASGAVTRHFPSSEVGPGEDDHAGYGDTVRVDVADLAAAFGPLEEGDCFDVLQANMIQADGTVIEAESELRDLHAEPGDFVDLDEEALKRCRPGDVVGYNVGTPRAAQTGFGWYVVACVFPEVILNPPARGPFGEGRREAYADAEEFGE